MKRILAASTTLLLLFGAVYAQELDNPHTRTRSDAAPETKPQPRAEGEQAEAPAEQGVQWLHEYDEAKVLAAKEKKKLFLCFSTSWCPPCKLLQANVWSSEDVAKRVAKDFVPCKVDGDTDKGTMKLFDVRSFPTIILAQADGSVIVKEVGAKALGGTPESTMMWIDDQLKTPGRLASLEKAHKDDPRDAIAAKKLADAYFTAGRKADAARVYDLAEKLLQDALVEVKLKQVDALIVSKDGVKAAAIMDELLPRLLKARDERAIDSACTFANLVARHVQKKDPYKARVLMLCLMESFPGHKRYKEFRCWAMMYAHMNGDNETAIEEAQKLVDEGPSDDRYVDRCSRFIKNLRRGHKYR